MPRQKSGGSEWEYIGGGRSKLKPGTRGTLKGTASYSKKDGTTEPRGHFKPKGGGNATTVSMKYLRSVDED